MSNLHKLHNMWEADIDKLLASIATEKLYSRTANMTEIICIDQDPDDPYLPDGSIKYIVEIKTDNDKLLKQFSNNLL